VAGAEFTSRRTVPALAPAMLGLSRGNIIERRGALFVSNLPQNN
jgi:hypothetical protein